MEATPFYPLVDLFLRGVAKLKNLQDEVSYVLVLHLEVSVNPHSWEVTLKCQCPLLRIGNLDHLQGAHVFVKIDLRFELSSVVSSIFTIPRMSWWWWHREKILDIYSWFCVGSENLNVTPSLTSEFSTWICYFLNSGSREKRYQES